MKIQMMQEALQINKITNVLKRRQSFTRRRWWHHTAEEFREFFLNRIINIRKLFHKIPPYKTQEDTIPRFAKFSTRSEANLKTIINQIPSKSCELNNLNNNTEKSKRCAYSSNNQHHQSTIEYVRILWKLDNCCHKTFNQIESKRQNKIQLLNSQISTLYIKSSWKMHFRTIQLTLWQLWPPAIIPVCIQEVLAMKLAY